MLVKKLVFIITFCVFTALLFENFAFAETKTYYIETFDDLKVLETDPSADFILLNDIMFYEPVGMLFCDSSKPFRGVFDGNGHTFIGLEILSDNENVALFGYNSGTIRSLNISSAKITAGSSSKNAGGLVYKNNGTIENCTFSGLISLSNKSISGTEICALNFGEVKNCEALPYNSQDTNSDKSDGGFGIKTENQSSQEYDSSENITVSNVTSDFVESDTSDSAVIENTTSVEIAYSSSSNVKIAESSKPNSTKASSKPVTTSKASTSAATSSDIVTTSSQYDDRQELKNYFVSSDIESEQKSNLPAAIMLGMCAVALVAIFVFVIYKEIVAARAEKQKKANAKD